MPLIRNFSFLEDRYPEMAKLGELAENNLYIDPQTTLLKLRIFAERVCHAVWSYEDIGDPDQKPLHKLINGMYDNYVIARGLQNILHSLRTGGDKSTHYHHQGTISEAKTNLKFAFRLTEWFYQGYENQSVPNAFEMPQPLSDTSKELQKLKKETQVKEQELKKPFRKKIKNEWRKCPKKKNQTEKIEVFSLNKIWIWTKKRPVNSLTFSYGEQAGKPILNP